MSDDQKKLTALLNGIARNDYYGESDITETLLKDQIYPDLSEESFHKLLAKTRKLVKSMAMSDMDFNQLEAFLLSFMKKKEDNMTNDEAKVYAKFWKNHKNRIHESLVNKTKWNDNLKSVNWRVDIINKTKYSEVVNHPVTIVELEIENKNNKKVLFEMDENQLNNFISQLNNIKDTISKYT